MYTQRPKTQTGRVELSRAGIPATHLTLRKCASVAAGRLGATHPRSRFSRESASHVLAGRFASTVLAVLDIIADITLATLMTTPCSNGSRLYRAKTRLRRSPKARAIAFNASSSPAKSRLITITSSPAIGQPHR